MSNTRYVNNPQWILLVQQGLLLASGGSDEIYVVDEIANATAAERLHAAWREGVAGDLREEAACGAAVRQLVRMGILVPEQACAPRGKFALRWWGEPLAAVQADLARLAGFTTREEEADCWVILRTDASWEACLAQYKQGANALPHLFVDVAYHHTMCVGPYVVPGETACISCMGSRVAHRWGDIALPATPRAASEPALIAALVAQLLGAVQEEPSGALLHYLERVVSLNLTTLESRTERVFRLPICPVCHPDGAHNAVGKLNLPWV